MSRSILVCRVAWMDFYEGVGADKPVGGGSYVEEHGFGHEVYNFQCADDGFARGYVRTPSGGQHVERQKMNLERLGSIAADDTVEGVTVFWCARHPTRGGSYVVGWYNKAKVYRTWQPSPGNRPLPDDTEAGFMIESVDAYVIPTDDRLFVVPRAQDGGVGMGQANIWYAGENEEWSDKLVAYQSDVLKGFVAPEPLRTRAATGSLQDTEARQRVELAAMKAVAKWCEERGHAWRDVSAAKVGWDIEAGEGDALLRIEVKGTSRELGTGTVELTPNEYENAKAHAGSYRIAIVPVTDGVASAVSMFSWSAERQGWASASGNSVLNIEERVAARCTVVLAR